MSTRLRYMAAVAGAAALLAGCGSDDEPEGEGIPADSVASIDERLDEVQRRFDAGVEDDNVGACDDIEGDSIPAIQRTVSELPRDVDPDIRQTLEDGIQRLRGLVQEGCAEVKPTETETTPEETVTETVPEETETTPPETETTPPETTPPEETTPQDPGTGGEGGAQAPDDGGD